jgi:hypothetical protein
LTLLVLFILGFSMSLPLGQPITSDDTTTKASSSSFPAQEPEIKIWHHDCTNASGFYDVIIPEFPFIGRRDYWSDTEGNIESDGQSLYLINITEPNIPNPDFYGPVFVYDLPDMFPVSGLRHLHTQMEMINAEPENVSAVAVALFDETKVPILISSCRSSYSNYYSINRSYLSWQYNPRNLSILDYFFDKSLSDYRLVGSDESLDHVNTTWSASYTPSLGITGYVPPWGDMTALDDIVATESDLEPARAVKYLGIMMGGYFNGSGYPPISSSRIHDIVLEYEIGGAIDTSPPLLSPQPDIEYIVGQKGNRIEWNCTDDHPYRYWLSEFRYSYRANLLNQETGPWNGSDFVISVDGIEKGRRIRTFVLILQDNAGFMVLDYVEITVIKHPFITAFMSVIQNPFFIGLTIGVTILAAAEWDYRRSRKKRAQAYKSSEST